MKTLTAVAVVMALVASPVAAVDTTTYIPEKARPLLPTINKSITELWPTLPWYSYIPAQIEQETCVSLTHIKCFNSRTRLKTSREEGIGLGQFTRAWDKYGNLRFDVVTEMVNKHPKELAGWSWANIYSPILQIKAILIKNRVNWNKLTFNIATLEDRMAILAVTYNSGSVFKDRTLCGTKPDCDPTRWYNTVQKKGIEAYSFKSKLKRKEYGNRSFFEISRVYPILVLKTRRQKYIPYTGT